jgi:hypothetical protein
MTKRESSLGADCAIDVGKLVESRLLIQANSGAGKKQVLQVLIEAYPDAVAKPAIDEVTGFKRSTRDAYLSRLGVKELVTEVGRAEVKASDTLFEAA